MTRLYPGFGSGKVPAEFTFQCYDSDSRLEIEASDKIVLPQSALKEITRLKIPFPLTFEICNARFVTQAKARGGKRRTQQYCGVLEFSAPDQRVLLPRWMMRNLQVREGGRVNLKSVADLPSATFCRLQAHDSKFLDIAAAVGPKQLLSEAFRHYTALSEGERTVICYGGTTYSLDVINLRPSAAVSLLGDIDLEVDFAPPKDSSGVGRRPGAAAPKARSNATAPATATAAASGVADVGDSYVPQSGLRSGSQPQSGLVGSTLGPAAVSSPPQLQSPSLAGGAAALAGVGRSVGGGDGGGGMRLSDGALLTEGSDPRMGSGGVESKPVALTATAGEPLLSGSGAAQGKRVGKFAARRAQHAFAGSLGHTLGGGGSGKASGGGGGSSAASEQQRLGGAVTRTGSGAGGEGGGDRGRCGSSNSGWFEGGSQPLGGGGSVGAGGGAGGVSRLLALSGTGAGAGAGAGTGAAGDGGRGFRRTGVGSGGGSTASALRSPRKRPPPALPPPTSPSVASLLAGASSPSSPASSSYSYDGDRDTGAVLPCSRCHTCGRDVPTANLAMHVMRCERAVSYHVRPCPECGERLTDAQRQQHLHCPEPGCGAVLVSQPLLGAHQQLHRRERCVDCGVSSLASELPRHRSDECPCRPLRCAYCELPQPAAKHEEHARVCGARTTACEDCQALVQRSELVSGRHADACRGVMRSRSGAGSRRGSGSGSTSRGGTRSSSRRGSGSSSRRGRRAEGGSADGGGVDGVDAAVEASRAAAELLRQAQQRSRRYEAELGLDTRASVSSASAALPPPPAAGAARNAAAAVPSNDGPVWICNDGPVWICSVCTYRNTTAASTDTSCAMCGIPGPSLPAGRATTGSASSTSSAAPSASWICSSCTFCNRRGQSSCEMCNATPPVTATSTATTPGVGTIAAPGVGGGVRSPTTEPRSSAGGGPITPQRDPVREQERSRRPAPRRSGAVPATTAAAAAVVAAAPSSSHGRSTAVGSRNKKNRRGGQQ